MLFSETLPSDALLHANSNSTGLLSRLEAKNNGYNNDNRPA
jgi:hypothetical protein